MLGELVVALVAGRIHGEVASRGEGHASPNTPIPFYKKDGASLYLLAVSPAAAELRGGVMDGDGWPPS